MWTELVENLGHRAWLSAHGARQLGSQRWYWRLGYALWLESLTGAAHRPGQKLVVPAGWQREDLIYGETPPVTAHALLQRAGLQAGQALLEVGCGRGVTSLVAALAFEAGAVGLEVVPALVDKARRLAAALQVAEIEFICRDAAKESLPACHVVYLTPTTWSRQNYRAITQRLAELPPGTRSVCLTDPLPEAQWRIVEHDRMPFSWGWSRTFWQERL